MNIGFGSLSTAPRQMYLQRQKASQPAFSAKSHFSNNNNGSYDDDYIPFLGGRPDRYTRINDDDVTNIKIGLETTNDVNEFLDLLNDTGEKSDRTR
jgi:hypothetical protein